MIVNGTRPLATLTNTLVSLQVPIGLATNSARSVSSFVAPTLGQTVSDQTAFTNSVKGALSSSGLPHLVPSADRISQALAADYITALTPKQSVIEAKDQGEALTLFLPILMQALVKK